MSIEQKYIDDAFKEICLFYEDETAQMILDNIISFTQQYTEINESGFIINEIFNSKLGELLDVFKKSDYIQDLVSDGTIDPNTICTLRPHELEPCRYQKIIDKKTYEHKKKKGTNAYVCKKCNQSNCEVSQKQSRSADESATTTVKCLECGFTYRF